MTREIIKGLDSINRPTEMEKKLNLLGHSNSCKCCCTCSGRHLDSIGDNFITNCRVCGVFLPSTGRKVLRDEKVFKMPVDVHVADTLRAAYRVCLE
jgi:hypothetical protein